MANPIMLWSWPKAILHIDVDAFFASCEQSIHPEYKGKPVITGKERNIVAAASYEAKELGIKRGIPIWQVKKICPDAIIVPSDYETYSLFSKRMFEIIRRFTPTVEEYSIDEAFAEITGFRRTYHKSYEKIALDIKSTLESELGFTVSVGLSLSKVLAKIGSKFKKPAGFVPIPGNKIHLYLAKWPLSKIWGIGPQTTAFLKTKNLNTSLDYANQSEKFIKNNLTKPHHEIWRELNGESVYPVQTEEKHDYQSISKTKTFTPPSSNKNYVYSHLFKNLENACIKVRRHKLIANGIIAFIKKQDFRAVGLKIKLNRASSYPHEIAPLLKKIFNKIFDKRNQYRATGIVLFNLNEENNFQYSLFESPVQVEKIEKIYMAADELAKKFGKHTVHMGASLLANTKKQHLHERGDIPIRKLNRVKGESARKHVWIPMLNSK